MSALVIVHYLHSSSLQPQSMLCASRFALSHRIQTTKEESIVEVLMLDILINLPHNVIGAIMMHLPCKDVVRPSILSKKWWYHWCRLIELTFD